jgi:2-dehydro-3-deoxygluconokinase
MTSNDTNKVLCFGELLLRLSPDDKATWLTNKNIPVFIGGAELNVATAISNWGIDTRYFTSLPDNFLAHEVISYIKQLGIDPSCIPLSGNKIGIYFLPQGKDLKNAKVIYDRIGSSFYELKPKTIDWEPVLKDVTWVHFSAITPGLNKNLAALTKELVREAHKKNITISVDLNYRSKLWNHLNPLKIMPGLVNYCDVIMGNIWSVEQLLGIGFDNKLLEKNTKNTYLQIAECTSALLQKKFPKCKYIANTFRLETGVNEITYFSTLFSENILHASKEISNLKINNRIGSGDCFMAGLIYGLQKKIPLDQLLNFSAAAAICKMYEATDATAKTVDEILLYVNNPSMPVATGDQ